VIARQKGGVPEVQEGKRVVGSHIRVPPLPPSLALSFRWSGYVVLYDCTRGCTYSCSDIFDMILEI
jgi:hypothetical protein